MNEDSRVGVLLVNLGTPTEPTAKAVRRFLRSFLGDRRVVDLPRLPWQIILNTFILPFRPKRVAKLYEKIWIPEGSPLRVFSQRLANRLATELSISSELDVPVALGMTYGEPSFEDAMLTLSEKVERIIVLPLYPQYSLSTTGSVLDLINKLRKKRQDLPETLIINDYHNHPAYIDAIAASIQEHWAIRGKGERLLFSFHGLPKRQLEKGDPYITQCRTTAGLVVEALGLEDEAWRCSFQSRFGPAEWVKPYTTDTLVEWAENGVKSVDVISPGFSVDCLETLEELEIQNKESFCEAGGETFHYIPALNDHPSHASMLTLIVDDVI